jgi:chorismate lyase/3-hydroxybenzoate synthase
LSATSSPSSAASAVRRAGFGLSLGSQEGLTEAVRRHAGRLLFAIRYGAPRAALSVDPVPALDVPNRVLGGGPSLELWHSPEPVEVQRSGRFVCADNGMVLFGAATCPLAGDLEAETVALYREMLEIVTQAGAASLQRLWNYLPDINGNQHGVERYKRFSAGRARAFEGVFGIPAERHFPASSAIGTTGDSLVVAFLAAREPGRHVENPRQVSAFRYPPQYGEKSPSFARGTLSPAALGHAFLLSGTASVVGHESRHEGDVLRQLQETLDNIETLSAAVGTVPARSALDLARFDYVKTYLRRPSDFLAVRDALTPRLGPAASTVWLEADICRAELLLEIEGIAL